MEDRRPEHDVKSIACINTIIPTAEMHLPYVSKDSLRDYDIAVFDPAMPYLDRIYFDGGGSCLSIDATVKLKDAMSHWASEFQAALAAGKTIFVIMSERKEDLGASGSTYVKGQRTYSTYNIDNYQAVPAKLSVKNASGRKMATGDSRFRGVYEVLKDIAQYRVVINSGTTETTFTAKDGATVGAITKYREISGTVVLLPYFSFEGDALRQSDDEGNSSWTEEALKTSNALIGQLVAIDKALRSSTQATPPPNWVSDVEVPHAVHAVDQAIAELDRQMADISAQRKLRAESKADLLGYTHLLYETGKNLERAIEKALRLLGYTAETVQSGELEIDHVIVGPSGKRMIGETEGRDSAAIDITKFRQLESNIGEDFEREEVDQPAKGVLFGNGFRLTTPSDRPEQFTHKSLTNAKRLGSALIRTADLYPVVAHLLDHPDDEGFKLACRLAIEETAGGIVEFPASAAA
ncbi:MAG TPA: hypothetical protein VF680_02460 [Allosphingosinicella sp.]